MTETPIYDHALELFAELGEQVDALTISGSITTKRELINTRAIVCSNLAIAEALHRTRDTLAGSSDE